MKVVEAETLEVPRLRRRIVAEHGRFAHQPLPQTHALAVFQIDSRKKSHQIQYGPKSDINPWNTQH
jgi:hypothetical protein